MVIFLLFLRVVFIIFSTHDISVLLLCICTQKRISIISPEFSHTLTVLSNRRRVKNTCYRARALLLLFLLVLNHRLFTHGWPQGISVYRYFVLLLFFIPYRASLNYIRLTVASGVSLLSHCCVHTFGHDPGHHLFFHQFQFVGYDNGVTAAAQAGYYDVVFRTCIKYRCLSYTRSYI